MSATGSARIGLQGMGSLVAGERPGQIRLDLLLGLTVILLAELHADAGGALALRAQRSALPAGSPAPPASWSMRICVARSCRPRSAKSGCCDRLTGAYATLAPQGARSRCAHSTSCAAQYANHSPPAPGASWISSACGMRPATKAARSRDASFQRRRGVHPGRARIRGVRAHRRSQPQSAGPSPQRLRGPRGGDSSPRQLHRTPLSASLAKVVFRLTGMRAGSAHSATLNARRARASGIRTEYAVRSARRSRPAAVLPARGARSNSPAGGVCRAHAGTMPHRMSRCPRRSR